MPECPEWGLIEKLKYEKEAIGIYLTGHPLDNYRFEMDNFCTHQVKHLSLINRMKSAEVSEEDKEEFNKIKNRDLVIGGLVSMCNHRTTKTGKPFGVFMLEDYSETFEIALFGEEYVKMRQYLNDGFFLQIRGTVLRSRSLAEKIDATSRFEREVVPLFAAGKLRPVVDEVFPLGRIADAHRRMESNESVGKIVIEL